MYVEGFLEGIGRIPRCLITQWGFPCCVRFPCVHAAATTPAQRPGVLVQLIHPAVSAFPENPVGSACASSFSRFARRSLALRPAHSRSHQLVTAIRRLQPFRYLHDCSDCFRRERIAGWDLHPLESAAFVTAHTQSGRSPRGRHRPRVCQVFGIFGEKAASRLRDLRWKTSLLLALTPSARV